MNGLPLAIGVAVGLTLVGAVRQGNLNRPLSAERRAELDVLADAFQFWVADRPNWDFPSDVDVSMWGQDHDLEFLGMGTTRSVFRIPEGAFKIASTGRANRQNRREIRVWRDAPAGIRTHLVPVIAFAPDGRWLIMEAATPAWDEPPTRVVDLFRRCGFMDTQMENFSQEGRLLDYAEMSADPRAWARCVQEMR